jgi:hypothetical protein
MKKMRNWKNWIIALLCSYIFIKDFCTVDVPLLTIPIMIGSFYVLADLIETALVDGRAKLRKAAYRIRRLILSKR